MTQATLTELESPPKKPLIGSNIPLRGAEECVGNLASKIERIFAKSAGRSPPQSPPNVSVIARIEHCSRLLSGIEETNDELHERLAKTELLNHEQGLQLKARSQESQTDALTGLANRRYFQQQFDDRCLAAATTHCPIIIAILDIDHFKAINDTRGHHVGDAVLRGLAKVISGLLPTGAIAARLGGEEFGILLSGVYLDQAIEAIESLRIHVRRAQFRYEGQPLTVTISCGLAQLASGEHSTSLLQRSDAAMYAAKQAGRNRTFWDDGNKCHLVANNDQNAEASIDALTGDSPILVLDLSSIDDASTIHDEVSQAASVLTPRAMRGNWCDGAGLFWYLRQRLTEWKRGGEPFSVLAIDVDNSSQIANKFGQVALHFMMRAQMLHFDAVFRDMDIIARTCNSKVIVVLPRTTISTLRPVLQRLRETMDRFAYPAASELLEYSVSLGATDVAQQDDAQQLVNRVEAALATAQSKGIKLFFATDPVHTWDLDGA
jgi:diguanylate cyclase (GGDEF)-like protein